MDFKGLVIATNYLNLDHSLSSNKPYTIEHKHTIENKEMLVTSIVEMALISVPKPTNMYPALKTTLNFWIDNNDAENAERVLFSVKTQFSQMYFILYQKMTELKLGHIKLHPLCDKDIYQAIKSQIEIADLVFNDVGAYEFPF
jgi:hypothetical protein